MSAANLEPSNKVSTAGVPPAPPEGSSHRQMVLDDKPIFDLTLLDVIDGVGLFRDTRGHTLELPLIGSAWTHEPNKQTKLNQRGVARPGNGWVFHAYLDQSLERRPELDQIARYGWTCRSKPAGFTCPAWIVPGDNGEFFEDETELFHIHVPPEFMELCDHFGMDIEAVLYGFIADAAGLRNWACCPRADELCSHGSDERMLAQQYLERTYGWQR